ncbi:MAG TPA: CoA transferase, partial [Tepidiformaceae bacterium]|nr:CoA transferase [Tepidiformaceae bacterium]
MPGPLHGIKVFEVSQIVAGPFAGQQLADLGADVVKCEPPGGEGMRVLGQFVPGESKGFHGLNRGKRSLVIDLHRPEGQAILHRLIPQYDVFIINARPGVPERLRADYETLRQLRPDIVYLENTGYGKRGPSAARSGSDVVMQGFSGLMAAEGKVGEYGEPAMMSSFPPSDISAGLGAAMGVCAALFHRQRTGEGQYIGSTLLGAALAIQSISVGKLPVFDALVSEPAMEKVRAIRDSGGTYEEMLAARGNTASMLGKAFRLYYGGYVVKDGALILGALTPLNREQMRQAMGIAGEDPTAAPDFNAFDPANEAVVEAIAERIRSIMRSRTMDEWIERFDQVGAPASKVNFPEDMAEDPQVQAMEFMVALDHD